MINRRIEDLEKPGSDNPVLVLWGDWDNPDICRAGGMLSEETLPWDEAIERYQENYILMCVRYVDDWRKNENN